MERVVSTIVMQGELRPLGLFNLVQLYGNAGLTGILRIYQGSLTFTIYLERGCMVATESPGQDPMGERLIRQGRLERSDLSRCLEVQRRLRDRGRDAPLGQILIRTGIVRERDVEDCVFDQLIETVCLALELPDPYFSFAQGDIPLRRLLRGFDLQHALLEAVRIADQIKAEGRVEQREKPPGPQAATPSRVPPPPTQPQATHARSGLRSTCG
jgi:hypothetical protein